MKKISKLPSFQTRAISKPNVILYGLKCVSVTPRDSHPNRYWKKDAKTFIALANKAVQNNAKLLLVNYSDVVDSVKIIDVDSITNKGIKRYKEYNMSKDGYNVWLKNIKQQYSII